MAAVHGKNGYLTINSENLTTFLKSTGLDRTKDAVDVTTFGKTSKDYIPGLKDGTIPLEGVADATVLGHIEAIFDSATAVAFEYGPFGNTAGLVKYSGNCIMTNQPISQDIGSEVQFSATLQITGDVTKGVWT